MNPMIDRTRELIELFQLAKHPEGGYFREVYRSTNRITIDASGKSRSALTDIYFLLTNNDFSKFHRVRHDEIWHFYEGSPLVLTEINPDTFDMKQITLGERAALLIYKHCVKGNVWQSAYSKGAYSFVGCTVGPGFEFDDFEMMINCKETITPVLSKYPGLRKYV